MAISRIFWILVFSFAGSFVGAEDGKAHYEMFCGACHNPDGKGAGEGAFPPLAGSEWVQGDPERMVQLILHGLEGQIQVSGKNYNLAMPPQGGSLSDDKIAAIVSYVRQAWGNGEKPVDEAFVKAARNRTNKRDSMWKPKELLQRWPLPSKVGPIRNLKATIYKGEFQTMPDFSKLQPAGVEEDAGGYLDLASIGLKEHFAVVWEGEFDVENKGDHTFQLDSDDGSRVYVNGTLVTEVKRVGPMGRTREGRVLLEEGTAKLRVEYFEYRGQEGIALAMRRGKKWTYFTKTKSKAGPKYPPIPVVAKKEPRIYRNFIKGSSARAIGVGYPEGVNLAFSADDLGLGVAWLGDFIDGGLHWTGRGQGFQNPGGQRILSLGEGPTWARGDGSAAWPKTWQPELKARFRGYFLDEKRRPEFRYEVAGMMIHDKPEAVKDHELVRNFTFMAGKKPPESLLLRLSGPKAKAQGSHSFHLSDGVRLEVAHCDSMEPMITKAGVVIKLKLKPGENRLGVRYVWK